MTDYKMLDGDGVFNIVLKEIYGMLTLEDSRAILKILLSVKELRAKDLLVKSGVSPSNFYNVLSKLISYNIVNKIVDPKSKSSYYSLSLYAEKILELSEKFLDEIYSQREQYVDDDISELNKTRKQEMSAQYNNAVENSSSSFPTRVQDVFSQEQAAGGG